jgi:hypothetical protein
MNTTTSTPVFQPVAPTPLGPVPPGAHDTSTASLAAAAQQLLAGLGDLTDETKIEATLSFEFPGLPRHAFLLADVVLDVDGQVRLVEANGSNAAGGSVYARDLPRVDHEVATMRARDITMLPDAVLITPESPDSRSLPEIRVRAALRATRVAEEYGVPVTVARAGQTLPSGVVALWGPIPEIADRLGLDAAGLTYDGRPVVFVNNVNVLVELARRLDRTIEDVLAATTSGGRPDPVHDGADMALLSLDKIRQQQMLDGVEGARPVAVGTLSRDLDDVVASALETAATFGGSIIKPMAASGGTGVIPVDPTTTAAEVRAALDEAAAKLQAKYGDGWQNTCPFSVFEFIDIQPADTGRGHHRWDLRLQVLATPDRTIVTPLSARLCPEPIGPVINRATGVNNMTGRSTAEVNRVDVDTLVELVGVGHEALEHFATTVFEFTRRALDSSETP